jgi:DNA adenine methylase
MKTLQKPARPVLRYHGGKWKLAKWIISYFPPRQLWNIYTESYGGAASMLMQMDRSYAEVYNDKWGRVVNVFRVLRDTEKSARLEELLRLTPFARDEFVLCDEKNLCQIEDDVEMARRTIFRSFAGFGSAATNGNYATGFRSNSNRSGTTPAHDWANYPNQIQRFTERLKGVVIENRDAVDVLRAHDGPKTLHFVDPPYVHATRQKVTEHHAYAYEMSDGDHRALAEVLRNLEGFVFLCGYPSDLYDNELFPDWQRIERKAFADGAAERTEVLWISPNTPLKGKMPSLFSEEGGAA